MRSIYWSKKLRRYLYVKPLSLNIKKIHWFHSEIPFNSHARTFMRFLFVFIERVLTIN